LLHVSGADPKKAWKHAKVVPEPQMGSNHVPATHDDECFVLPVISPPVMFGVLEFIYI
jgi:hypothetical protein